MLGIFLPTRLQDSSGGSLCSSEQMDLQVDYWLAAGNKKDINKVS